ncbi:MAG: hypothetical protein ACYDBV_14890 [Nitrospiria bacterium]
MKQQTKKRIETIKLMQRKRRPSESVGLLIQRGLKALPNYQALTTINGAHDLTIEVSITNKDTAKTIQVEYLEYDKELDIKEVSQGELKPGEGRTFAIHLLRDIKISEVNPTYD